MFFFSRFSFFITPHPFFDEKWLAIPIITE